MRDLAVVCWLWSDGNRQYLPEHARRLSGMFKRHLGLGHQFVCITDDKGHFGPDVEVMPTPETAKALGALKTLESPHFPSCYRRLWMFSEEAASIAKQVLCVDVDMLLAGDITHLVARDEEFVGWRPLATWGGTSRLGGGLYLLKTGTRRHVWDDFNPAKSPRIARAAGFRGSDQAWLSFKLYGKETVWPRDAGIYSVRDFREPPAGAKLIQFNGMTKPWSPTAPQWAQRIWRDY